MVPVGRVSKVIVSAYAWPQAKRLNASAVVITDFMALSQWVRRDNLYQILSVVFTIPWHVREGEVQIFGQA